MGKSKYHRQIPQDEDGYSDVYDVLLAFNVTDPAIAHAVKKLLAPGQRSGGKSLLQDIEEARWSIDRAVMLAGGESIPDLRDAYQGAMEDKQMWKRRALAAENKADVQENDRCYKDHVNG